MVEMKLRSKNKSLVRVHQVCSAAFSLLTRSPLRWSCSRACNKIISGWAQTESRARQLQPEPTVKSAFGLMRRSECWDFINRMLIVCRVRRLRANNCATFAAVRDYSNTKECRRLKLTVRISLAAHLNKLKVNRSSGCVKNEKQENVWTWK